ncbi:MAG: hypothetical protein JKY37_22745, partial [Nannocystaceae bacterium]|nr:hypothetical protein [Nannocystaceae bacterium]
ATADTTATADTADTAATTDTTATADTADTTATADTTSTAEEPIFFVNNGVVLGPWYPPPPPDPAEIERNRRLSEKMHKGELWLIGGRVGFALSGISMGSGIALLATNIVRKREYPEGIGSPPNPKFTSGGLSLLALGMAGVAASATFAILGLSWMQEARRGKLSVSVRQRQAQLGYKRHF